MAQAPHDKTGKECSICHTSFTANSYTGTITKVRPVEFEFEGKTKTRNFRTSALVCRVCHNKHYSEGE